MKYTKIPSTTFQQLVLNAGIICTSFAPATGTYSGQLGATTGGATFNATPEYSDFGDDIDNCPKNMLELKHLDSWGVTLSGTMLTVSASVAQMLVGAGDVDGEKITPRVDLETTDFIDDLWLIADYSDVNTGDDAGYIAIHVMNALNTGGFQFTTSDKAKGQLSFNFEGHVSMDDPDTVPFEVYVHAGSEEEEESEG